MKTKMAQKHMYVSPNFPQKCKLFDEEHEFLKLLHGLYRSLQPQKRNFKIVCLSLNFTKETQISIQQSGVFAWRFGK